jgi:methionine synthase I (cobalamin-dependent)
MTKLKAFWLYLVDTFSELLDMKSAIEDADPDTCKCGYRHPIVVRDTIKYEGRTIFFVTCLSCNRSGTSQITALGAVRAWNSMTKG